MVEGIVEKLFTDKPLVPRKERKGVLPPEPLRLDAKEFLPAHKIFLTRWFQDILPVPDLDFSKAADLQSLLSQLASELAIEIDDEVSIETLYSQILIESYAKGQAKLAEKVSSLINFKDEARGSSLDGCKKIVQAISLFSGRIEDPFLPFAHPAKSLERSAPALISAQVKEKERPKLICQGRTCIAEAFIAEQVSPDITMDCMLRGHMTFIIMDGKKVYLADPTKKEPKEQVVPLEQIDTPTLKATIDKEGYYTTVINLGDLGERVRILPRNLGLIKGVLHLHSMLFSRQASRHAAEPTQYKNRLIASYLADKLGLLIDPNDPEQKIRCRNRKTVVRSLIGHQ